MEGGGVAVRVNVSFPAQPRLVMIFFFILVSACCTWARIRVKSVTDTFIAGRKH